MSASNERLRQAEVANLDAILGVKEAIRGLDVTVDHADLVGLFESLDHVHDLEHGVRLGERPLRLDEVFERMPRHQLHDDIRPAVRLVGREDEDASRVRDHARQPALLEETFDGERRRCELRGD